MSIVIAIIAVVVGGGMTIFAASLQKRQLQETQFKLRTIQKALFDFRQYNSRLPCPADATLAIPVTGGSTLYFGFEAGTLSSGLWIPDTGVCTTYATSYSNDVLQGTSANSVASNFRNIGTTTGNTTSGSGVITSVASTSGVVVGQAISGLGLPAGTTVGSFVANTSITLANSATATATATTVTLTFLDFVQGMVPTNALHLPDDYAIDGWGRRIMYTVDARLTGVNAFSSTIVPATDTGYRITVNDGDTSQNPRHAKTKAAGYVLVSFGPNGHGAYPRDGAAIGVRINAGSNNTDERANCDCNGSATSSNPIPVGIFYQEQPNYAGHQGDPSYYFDDIVVYGTRSDLRSPTE